VHVSETKPRKRFKLLKKSNTKMAQYHKHNVSDIITMKSLTIHGDPFVNVCVFGMLYDSLEFACDQCCLDEGVA